MTDILDIGSEPVFDDRIVKIETHTYNPYSNTSFGKNDEIRIPIQQQDLYTLPCESFLYIDGTYKYIKTRGDDEPTGTFVKNCVAFLFDEIRYELNGVEVDRCRNVGITSALKNYVSTTPPQIRQLQTAGWHDFTTSTNHGNFTFCVPLNILLGFCEDYKRIVINARHELILIRSRNDYNFFVSNDASDVNINLIKVQWRMPHVALNDITKLSMLKALESGRYLSMSFRSWDLYEFPLLQSTTKHSWAVKTVAQLEKPRYVIFALQTDRKNNPNANPSIFDHCKLINVKLHLNSEFYPYDDMNLDFDNFRYIILYEMYKRFQKSYYGRGNALLDASDFQYYAPIAVIDCSRQNEAIKSATVDVRIEFECKEDVPANTTAYCLIIHDRVIEYSPLTNVVRKIN